MTSPYRVAAALLFVPVLVAGCTSSHQSGSTVSGKVTYKGQPVTSGTITFHRTAAEQAGAYPYPLKSDGTYEGAGLVAEEMIVTIETESANPKQKTPKYNPKAGAKEDPTAQYDKMMREKGFNASNPPDPSLYVPIPKKYADKKTSPLKTTITKGRNSKDFDLQD